MAQIAENEQKVFKYYLQLPSNIRMKMIYKMEPNDRCRFTRCSSQCNKEAKACKNYIHELRVSFYSQTIIKVFYGYHNVSSHIDYGYTLRFSDMSGDNFLVYTSLDRRTSWEVELSSSTDLLQCAIEEFKELLYEYQKTIKKLSIDGMIKRDSEALKNIDFGIEGLDTIEDLTLFFPHDISRILSKLRKPLKNLSVDGEDNCKAIAECEQVYQVQNYISWPSSGIDYEKLQRFAAKNVDMHIGVLTEKDIFKFIRSWQNGTLGNEVNSYSWKIMYSNFDIRKLLRLLRVKNPENNHIEIKHFKEPGKTATFFHSAFGIRFYKPSTEW